MPPGAIYQHAVFNNFNVKLSQVVSTQQDDVPK